MGGIMKIISFSISNYRSMYKANQLPVSDKTILIGPNNEGKSNILYGFILTLNTLCYGLTRVRRTYLGRRKFSDKEYIWERDYPLQFQESNPNGASEFKIEFELSDDEKKEFQKITNVNLNSNLIIHLNFLLNKFGFSAIIKGLTKQKLDGMYEQISEFIGNNLSFQYIPAVRTSAYTEEIVERMVANELSVLDDNPEYNTLLNKIKKFQDPILKDLSKKLKESISEFVPDVIDIKIDTEETLKRAIRYSSNVIINDGIATNLDQKGDGIKSLVAISLAKHMTSYRSKGKSLIMALEEPESHLHPGAIHRLSNVLTEISSRQQVFVTTHSPLLIDRMDINKNIIVNKNNARPAKNIEEIRNIIGVNVSDNLINSSWVLLVEGESDKVILMKWFSEYSKKITELIQKAYLVIDTLNGGTNLSYKISQYRNMLCNLIIFLDNDECGLQSFEKAKSKALCDYKDVIFSSVLNKKFSEIEDLIKPEIYFDVIKNKYGFSISTSQFNKIKKAWSEKMSQIFRKNGKPWNDSIEKELKILVANTVKNADEPSLIEAYKQPIDNLINLIIKKLYNK